MTAEQMWERVIQDYPNYGASTYEAFSFGNTDIMADELALLVKAGKKTATSSVFCFYEMEGAALPQGGKLSILCNSKNEAECIMLTTKVYTTSFNLVSEEHAYKEGEGNQSLDDWREGYQAFFTEALAECNQVFDENMLIVCEKFKVIWK